MIDEQMLELAEKYKEGDYEVDNTVFFPSPVDALIHAFVASTGEPTGPQF